jgi:hypothetical protein
VKVVVVAPTVDDMTTALASSTSAVTARIGIRQEGDSRGFIVKIVRTTPCVAATPMRDLSQSVHLIVTFHEKSAACDSTSEKGNTAHVLAPHTASTRSRATASRGMGGVPRGVARFVQAAGTGEGWPLPPTYGEPNGASAGSRPTSRNVHQMDTQRIFRKPTECTSCRRGRRRLPEGTSSYDPLSPRCLSGGDMCRSARHRLSATPPWAPHARTFGSSPRGSGRRMLSGVVPAEVSRRVLRAIYESYRRRA